MTTMIHKNPDNYPIRQIDHMGREYTANDKGEFEVPSADVDTMKRHHGLVEKDQTLQK
jgi:hypothetical protein